VLSGVGSGQDKSYNTEVEKLQIHMTQPVIRDNSWQNTFTDFSVEQSLKETTSVCGYVAVNENAEPGRRSGQY